MKIKITVLAIMLSTSVFALAQQGGIGAVRVEPATVKVGQEVRITVSVDGEAPKFCGLRIEYGDGSEDFKIDETNRQFPVVVTRSYAKAGNYVVKARGKTVTTHMRCQGEAQATLVVEGTAAVAAKDARPACPEGYAPKGKIGKAGNFTCAAGKGAKKPEKVLDCAEGLEYFQTKAALGCRKAGK